jgi:hypothetical protein
VRVFSASRARGRIDGSNLPRHNLVDGKARHDDLHCGNLCLGRVNRVGGSIHCRNLLAVKLCRSALDLARLHLQDTALFFGVTQVAAGILPARPLAVRESGDRRFSLLRRYRGRRLQELVNRNRGPAKKAPRDRASYECEN